MFAANIEDFALSVFLFIVFNWLKTFTVCKLFLISNCPVLFSIVFFAMFLIILLKVFTCAGVAGTVQTSYRQPRHLGN